MDIAVLEANLQGMAVRVGSAGMELRPHAKTHKCIEIGRRQIAQGARGLSVATLGEAQIFAAAGIEDLFVAYPVWVGDRHREVSELATAVRLRLGIASEAAARRMAGALGSDRGAVGVLVEVDCGMGRSGVAPEQAGVVARTAVESGLVLEGVFTYPGHAYRPGFQGRARIDESDTLARAWNSVTEMGLECLVRSGGSTPTAWESASVGSDPPLNELRPGVYAFNDAQQLALGTCDEDDVALAVLCRVVDAPRPGRVVLDAGSKVLGADRPAWVAGHGVVLGRPDWHIGQLWEHHAVAERSGDGLSGRLEEGEVVLVVPNHVCSTVNLVDELHAVAEGSLVDRWAVAARGRNT